MALGYAEGFEAQQNRSLIGQRNDLLGRQVALQERAQITKEAQDRFALTFDAMNQMYSAALNSGKDTTKAVEAVRQMAATLNPIAEAMGVPPEAIQARVDAIISQPSAEALALREAKTKAAEKSMVETAKQNAETRAILDRRILGLGPDERTAFIKNVEFIFDPETPQDQKDFAMEQLNNKLSASGLGLSLEVTPEGGIKLTKGEGVPKDIMATRNSIAQNQERREELDASLDNIGAVEALFKTNPELFAALGSVTKFEQTITGIGKDAISGALPDVGESLFNLRDKIAELGFLPGGEGQATAADMESLLLTNSEGEGLTEVNSGTIDVLETTLKFSLLNAFTGGRRPLKTEIQEIKELTKLRGLISQDQLEGRLAAIRRRVERQIASNQRLLEKGVTGQATTKAPSVAPGGSTSSSKDDELDKALSTIFRNRTK